MSKFDFDDYVEDEEDDDDFFFDDDDEADLGMVVDEAEGIQVTTTFDGDGCVIGAYVQPSEEEEDDDDMSDVVMPFSKLIDSTILKADATPEQVIQLCLEARELDVAAVCVNTSWVRLCAELLRGSDVNVAATIGFPLGAMIPEAKAYEALCAIENGATEIDMVINIGALKAKDYRMVAKDINGVVQMAHEGGALVKVIIETCLLSKEEKVIACLLAKNAEADFVKTSTGFSTAGATVEDVELMRRVVGPDMGVKAAGGIRSLEDAKKMVEAGADRLGTSSARKILEG